VYTARLLGYQNITIHVLYTMCLCTRRRYIIHRLTDRRVAYTGYMHCYTHTQNNNIIRYRYIYYDLRYIRVPSFLLSPTIMMDFWRANSVGTHTIPTYLYTCILYIVSSGGMAAVMISLSGPADTVPAVKIKYNDFVHFCILYANAPYIYEPCRI